MSNTLKTIIDVAQEAMQECGEASEPQKSRATLYREAAEIIIAHLDVAEKAGISRENAIIKARLVALAETGIDFKAFLNLAGRGK